MKKVKQTKIVLEQEHEAYVGRPKTYNVLKLVNRVLPELGSQLTQVEVAQLIRDSDNLTVEIVPPS